MFYSISVLLFAVFASYGNCETTCEDSQKHFANLCFSATPSDKLDLEWTSKSQPDDGWHSEIGNDIARLHFAAALRGKSLNVSDNFDDMCFRFGFDKVSQGEYSGDGWSSGFGNLTAKWKCGASKDLSGVFICDNIFPGPSNYHENFNVYISYSDNKNLQIRVICFPNGQVGWIASTISKTLTEEEKKTVREYVTSLGFSEDNTVVLYKETCV